MKTSVRYLTAVIALSLAGIAYAGDKPAEKKEDEKKECCGCSDCKECKAGNCCCAPEKSDQKETKKDEKPAEQKKN